MNLPVTDLQMPRTHLSYGPEGKSTWLLCPELLRWEIARFEGYRLDEFDDLPGPEQSRCAARFEVYQIKERLLAGGLHGG